MLNQFIIDGIMDGPVPDDCSCDACYWATRPANCQVCRLCKGFEGWVARDSHNDENSAMDALLCDTETLSLRLWTLRAEQTKITTGDDYE